MEHVSHKTELFIAAYFDAIYFTEGEEVIDPPCEWEWDAVTVRDIHRDCLTFIDKMGYIECCGELESWSDDAIERAGHDFWLTRNGHGAGFWDGDWSEDYMGTEVGELLTEASRPYGDVYVHKGDDGLTYIERGGILVWD